MNDQDSPFAGWLALQNRLGSDKSLRVVEYRGYEWIATMEWNDPASSERIKWLKENLDIPLPGNLGLFLMLNDGCTLFKDKEFGQWGYYLYSTEEVISKRKMWSEIYPEWPSNYLVFGECLGDSDLLVMDTEKLSSDRAECQVHCFPHACPSEKEVMSETFQNWLDYLIIAQGAKFWRWK